MTLARRLKAAGVFIGELDDHGGEPLRRERIAAFALTRVVAARAGRTVLVVDEAEDIFCGIDDDDASSRPGSKVFMNRLVETTEAPTIWITNFPERLGPAVVRRMAAAVRFPEPNRAVRARIIARTLKRHKVALAPGETERLCAIQAPPALIETGIRTAAITGQGAAAIERSVRSLARAMGRQAPEPLKTYGGLAFDPALSAADFDLAALAGQVKRTGDLALSFCLYGPSGTGKSAYARYLASHLGMDVVDKRASDLLSMFVGGTEHNIARAFEEAQDRRAMLIIDEADSFLQDRSGARRSWEVTQVNEMLTHMERHPLPYVFTTNLYDGLDPATLRRFLFKVRFMPMTSEQAATAFRRAFAAEPPAGLARLDLLTPGDFAVVARKAQVLGERRPECLLAWLADEVAAKAGAKSRRVGFVP